MDSDRMGAMLERDFRGVLAETGKASLAFPLASGTLTVDAFARYSRGTGSGSLRRIIPSPASIRNGAVSLKPCTSRRTRFSPTGRRTCPNGGTRRTRSAEAGKSAPPNGSA